MTTVVYTASSYVQTEKDSEEDPLFHELPFIEYLDCLDALVALDRQSAYTSSQEESLWSCWTLLERRKRQD